MAAKRHMDIKRNITRHNIIITDITGYSLTKWEASEKINDAVLFFCVK
ncbi:hypothetical protein ACFLU4_07980 [Chloroflexota bacterium]